MQGKNGYFSPVSNGTGSGVNAREKRILFIRFQWNRERCERGSICHVACLRHALVSRIVMLTASISSCVALLICHVTSFCALLL